MSSTGFDAFDRATQTANVWLREVADRFGTDDRRLAYRALRAWLHTLRDRLTVSAVADFAAGLPELLRGVYYDGWQPAKVPIKFGADEYRLRFALEAGITPEEVDRVAGVVTAALRTRLAPGQLDRALDQLPHQLRTVMQHPAPHPTRPAATRPDTPAGVEESVDVRIERLQAEVGTLTEAVRALVGGLEQSPYQRPGNDRAGRAAHRAHELLLAAPTTVEE